MFNEMKIESWDVAAEPHGFPHVSSTEFTDPLERPTVVSIRFRRPSIKTQSYFFSPLVEEATERTDTDDQSLANQRKKGAGKTETGSVLSQSKRESDTNRRPGSVEATERRGEVE